MFFFVLIHVFYQANRKNLNLNDKSMSVLHGTVKSISINTSVKPDQIILNIIQCIQYVIRKLTGIKFKGDASVNWMQILTHIYNKGKPIVHLPPLYIITFLVQPPHYIFL